MTWVPLEDYIPDYISSNLDITPETTDIVPRMPCCGRGKVMPKLHELKPPKKLQELIEKNFPKKKPFGRGRGNALKYRLSRPGKSLSDSDSVSGTSMSAISQVSSQKQQKNITDANLINCANDIIKDSPAFPANFHQRKPANPVDWTDADFPTLNTVTSSPVKPKKKEQKIDKCVGKKTKENNVPRKSTESNSSFDNVNTVLIENLPRDLCDGDIKALLDSYGQVLKLEFIRHEDSSSCRVKLDSPNSCDWAVSCLDDTDSLFPEDGKLITCIQLG